MTDTTTPSAARRGGTEHPRAADPTLWTDCAPARVDGTQGNARWRGICFTGHLAKSPIFHGQQARANAQRWCESHLDREHP